MNDFEILNMRNQKMPSKLFMISLIIFTGFSILIIFCLFFIQPKVPLIYTAKLTTFPIRNSAIQKDEKWVLESDFAELDTHSDILFITKYKGKQIKIPIYMNAFQQISPEGNRVRYLVILKRKDVDFFSEDSVLNGELVILKSSPNNLFNNLLAK